MPSTVTFTNTASLFGKNPRNMPVEHTFSLIRVEL